MRHPELLLPTRPLRQRFLDLAEIILRQEVASLQPWGGGGLNVKWTPLNQASFAEPIALPRVQVTHLPNQNPKFTVVSSEFELLGDDGMTLTVSRQMRDADFPDDEWNQMVFERYANSYENHEHASCVLNIPEDIPAEPVEHTGFKIVDKRIRQ